MTLCIKIVVPWYTNLFIFYRGLLELVNFYIETYNLRIITIIQ
jgi:hypothetical protein